MLSKKIRQIDEILCAMDFSLGIFWCNEIARKIP